MITAGIDVGAKTVKVVIVKDGKILSKVMKQGGRKKEEVAHEAYNEALQNANLKKEDVAKVVSTGAGKKKATFAKDDVSEVGADARGALYFFPSVRTVIDVGAEEGRGVKCDATGKVIDFVINEKCGAGAGSFTEAMSRALEVKLEDMGKMSLTSKSAVPMNAQCAVFAESEVISLIHKKIPKEDIIRAVHDAIAARITSMIRTIGVEKDVSLVGGLSRNPGFVQSMKDALGVDVFIPEDPEFIGALGAALAAAG